MNWRFRLVFSGLSQARSDKLCVTCSLDFPPEGYSVSVSRRLFSRHLAFPPTSFARWLSPRDTVSNPDSGIIRPIARTQAGESLRNETLRYPLPAFKFTPARHKLFSPAATKAPERKSYSYSPGAGKKATGCILWQRRDAKMPIPAKEVSDLFWLAKGAWLHRP